MAARAAPKPPLGTVIQNADGTNSIYDGKQWVPAHQDPASPSGWAVDRQAMEAMGVGPAAGGNAGPSTRDRLALGLSAAIDAENRMRRWEAHGNLNRDGPGNPLGSDWGASALESMSGTPVIGDKLHDLAQVVGGSDFQDYSQAAKAQETMLLPIFSGAAVTQSEAQRFIRAAQPVPTDTVDTLRAKQRTRAMMLNGAAHLMGAPLPFPDVPTWGITSTGAQQQQPAQQHTPAAQHPTAAQAAQRPTLSQIFGP